MEKRCSNCGHSDGPDKCNLWSWCDIHHSGWKPMRLLSQLIEEYGGEDHDALSDEYHRLLSRVIELEECAEWQGEIKCLRDENKLLKLYNKSLLGKIERAKVVLK